MDIVGKIDTMVKDIYEVFFKKPLEEQNIFETQKSK
jgi:hypothetical protein